jgi:hypothetical protein
MVIVRLLDIARPPSPAALAGYGPGVLVGNRFEVPGRGGMDIGVSVGVMVGVGMGVWSVHPL